jgi:hypothetical protein
MAAKYTVFFNRFKHHQLEIVAKQLRVESLEKPDFPLVSPGSAGVPRQFFQPQPSTFNLQLFLALQAVHCPSK